jgi:hypothetical protein
VVGFVALCDRLDGLNRSDENLRFEFLLLLSKQVGRSLNTVEQMGQSALCIDKECYVISFRNHSKMLVGREETAA